MENDIRYRSQSDEYDKRRVKDLKQHIETPHTISEKQVFFSSSHITHQRFPTHLDIHQEVSYVHGYEISSGEDTNCNNSVSINHIYRSEIFQNSKVKSRRRRSHLEQRPRSRSRKFIDYLTRKEEFVPDLSSSQSCRRRHSEFYKLDL